jgi:SAM-dependent methyltransferase
MSSGASSGRQREASGYWKSGYRHDSRGAANTPDSYLPTYVDLLESLSYTHELVERSRSAEPESVLEVGCNSGRNLWVLSDRLGAERVAGVDISEEAIGICRERAPAERWDLRVRDVMADGMPTFDEPFDVVCSLASLVHMEPGARKGEIVREMWALTRKRLILIEAQRPRGPVEVPRNISDSPFWLDDYRAYLPELRDEGVARGSAHDSLDGLPVGRASRVVRPLRHALSVVNDRRGRRHPEVFHVLVADR